MASLRSQLQQLQQELDAQRGQGQAQQSREIAEAVQRSAQLQELLDSQAAELAASRDSCEALRRDLDALSEAHSTLQAQHASTFEELRRAQVRGCWVELCMAEGHDTGAR